MTDLIGSFGPVFVVSAAVFGPLTGWLAGRRDRHPVVWLVFGALLGPLAVLLLFAAPPGRCTMCDTQVRGWASICPVCGAPLTLGAGAGRYQEQEREPIARRPVRVIEPKAQPIQAPPTVAIRSVPALAMLATDPPEGFAEPEVAPPPIRLPIERSATARGRRPEVLDRPARSSVRSPYVPDREPEAEILATAVYFGGTAGLAVGGRYVVTRQGPLFRLLGPVDLDPTRVALERPLARLTAVAVGERLVITEGSGSRVSLAIGMGALAGMNGPDLEFALSRPDVATQDRRPASG